MQSISFTKEDTSETKMINIDRHIEILLLDNDCVVVPGLGGFIAHHVAAHYDENTQTYLPPLRTVGFNSQLRINDSLLAQAYIEAYDISYPEAIRRIEEEVNELLQLLSNEGKCELNDIGTLYRNNADIIEFTPCEAGILTPSLYGFDAIDITPILSYTDSKKTQKVVFETSGLVTTNEPAKVSTEETTADEEEIDIADEEERGITIKFSTLRNIASTAAMILLLFLFSLPLGKGLLSECATESAVNLNVISSLVKGNNNDKPVVKGIFAEEKSNEANPSEAVKEESKEAESTNNESANAEADNSKAVETKATSESVAKPFSLILASRVSTANGNAFIAELAKDGYKAELLSRTNGAKVIYGHYVSEEEARQELRRLRDTDERFIEAWIMEIK